MSESKIESFHVQTFPDGAMYGCFCGIAEDHDYRPKTLAEVADEIVAARENVPPEEQ